MSQNDISTGIGLRHVRGGLRDTDGTLKVPSGTPHNEAYSGLRIGGAQALTITMADPQKVTARGDDRAYHTFTLPPTEVASGELRVSKTDLDVVAMVSGTLVFGSPTMQEVGFGTDQQGLEPALILWGCRQAIDADDTSAYFGTQIWQTYFLLNAEASLKPSPMEDATVSVFTYSLVANDATRSHLGITFATGTHGFTTAQYLMIVSKNRFMLDAFAGDGVHKAFTLSQTPATSPAAVVRVTLDGVVSAPTDWTRTTTTLTFNAAPSSNAKILVAYEY